jgi:hypothetical protein
MAVKRYELRDGRWARVASLLLGKVSDLVGPDQI